MNLELSFAIQFEMNLVLRRSGFPNQVRFGKCFSSLVKVRETDIEGISIVNLNHPPVNSLNLETIKCLTREIEKLNKNEKSKGIILTSNLPKAFSAGVQLTEFQNPNPEKLREFWRAFQEMWYQLYISPLPTVAAINNHAIAGGCALSVVCDRRVMVKGTIGLNETKLGVVPPIWLCDRFIDLVGKNQGDYGIQCGVLYKPNEALKLGLVDRLSPEEDLIKTAKEELKQFLSIPAFAFGIAKLGSRQKRIRKFEKNFEKNLDDFVALIQNEKVQKEISKYFDSLKSKI